FPALSAKRCWADLRLNSSTVLRKRVKTNTIWLQLPERQLSLRLVLTIFRKQADPVSSTVTTLPDTMKTAPLSVALPLFVTLQIASLLKRRQWKLTVLRFTWRTLRWLLSSGITSFEFCGGRRQPNVSSVGLVPKCWANDSTIGIL